MRKINKLFVIFLLLLSYSLHGQNLGLNKTGTTADPSAALDINFTDAGLLIPRMTTTQRNAITSPANALLIFNTTTACIEIYNSATSTWQSVFCMCTIPSAPTALAASGITSTSFTANWTAVGGATTYYLDVATDAGFTSFVPGYNNLNVGNNVSYNVTGLSASTTYYYRVRASNSCGTSGNSNTITVTTLSSCPTTTNPSVVGNNWYTTTYQYGYEFTQLVTKTICQVEYYYSGGSGISGNIRFYTSAGSLLSSTAISTVSGVWTTVSISPITLSSGGSYVIVVDLNNGNSGGDFSNPGTVTYDSSVITYITGRYNNSSCCVFPSQTWGGYWGCLKMKY